MNHYTQSPKSDSAIAELCAQTVCFLWFESLPTLHEAASSNYPHHTRIPDVDSIARPEFVRWTRDVLSTTQVSVNVVILAMLFIYRLKIANPSVKGRAGSEYRLLTVALMLGNKFLDDNTYTNKTWADVTSISVKEIHLMEVEFLSNMRYQLMVHADEWLQWLHKINLFLRYQQQQRRALIRPVPMGLPSPPSSYDYQPFTPPHAAYRHQIPASAQVSAPVLESRSRKRSLGDEYFPDMHSMLPPNKKLGSSQPSTPQRGTSMMLRSTRSEQPSTNELSPSKRHNGQGPFPRNIPLFSHYQHKLPMPPINLAYPQQPLSAHSAYSAHSSNLSPSYLQVGTLTSTVSSPTTSPTSQYSSHSHGAPSGQSPTSLAMRNRNSPYAPVQPVQRLVGKYQPIFNPSQLSAPQPQSLWYSQLAAGESQPIYRGRVPLSAQSSPYHYQPRY